MKKILLLISFFLTSSFASEPMSVVSLSSGVGHSCAVLSSGITKCWGILLQGVHEDSPRRPSVPVTIEGITDAQDVSSGNFYNCVVRGNGRVACWGETKSGLVGNRGSDFDLKPIEIDGLDDVKMVSVGSVHACALQVSGRVKCWGSNSFYALGNGMDSNFHSSTPVDVIGVENAIKIASYSEVTCALIKDGTVKCWGENDLGQLGNSNGSDVPFESTTVPVAVNGVVGASDLAVGSNFGCAVLATGMVQCWGQNEAGAMGIGIDDHIDRYYSFSRTATFVNGLKDAISVSADYDHTCVIKKGGVVSCWGWDLTTNQNSLSPLIEKHLLGENVRAISVGFNHSCALIGQARVKCWGFKGDLGRETLVLNF